MEIDKTVLIFGPTGCGKKTFAMSRMESLGLNPMFTHIVDCFEKEIRPSLEIGDGDKRRLEWNRKEWLDNLDYFANNIDTEAICIWNIDEVPKLWQRGLLTRLEKWNYHESLHIFITARSLSRVDQAFISRCSLIRKESRFKDLLLDSFHKTDYDFHSSFSSSSSSSSSSFFPEKRDEMFFHLDTLWKNFLDGKVDTDLYIKDLFYWGMTAQEIVYTLLDVFASPSFAYTLDQMSEIVSCLNSISLQTATWIHIFDWLIRVKKIIT
jgi:hypothetical protein